MVKVWDKIDIGEIKFKYKWSGMCKFIGFTWERSGEDMMTFYNHRFVVSNAAASNNQVDRLIQYSSACHQFSW